MSKSLQTALKNFDFETLFFEELGWDQYQRTLDIAINNETYHLQAIAEKCSFVVFRCSPAGNGSIPARPIRQRIDTQVAKSFREHLIIFTDEHQTTQIWQWVRRDVGRPSAFREQRFERNQSGEALTQKLTRLIYSLEEEERLPPTIVDVSGRTRAAFDVERVTRRFYDRFKAEQVAFADFLQGIPDEDFKRWYVSVMLNRLMFIYFIQQKRDAQNRGFLDGDPAYLRNRLKLMQYQGRDRYYRDFLCPLFFQGFAQKKRDPEIERLLGSVPYLNGGLFLRHQVEERYGQAIQIPDVAFERLYEFFEQYQWHLDERPLCDDREINPDVLGYIFEKYINQKQMGAYYTKEDITEYIGKNTILPYLLDQVSTAQPSAFDAAAWPLLQADPDRYIYPAVLYGVHLELPQEIEAGVHNVDQRGEWNKPALSDFALPTEIWRETVARRQRCTDLRSRLSSGEVHQVNDLITYNLDIRQFAQDVIAAIETPELLRAFMKALGTIKVLDPTVGSGAFLFAVLNILEPLYEACLERMQELLDELDASGEKHRPEKLKDFREILGHVAQHPNERYFILKSIIVHNLYGVDIMEEAVEICKLRLFLKLVAQLDDADHIEPLPDIDFNVRTGNTLVGFASQAEVKTALTQQGAQGKMLLFEEDRSAIQRIERQAEDIARLFQRLQQQQTEVGGEVTPEDKQALRQRLRTLEDELNQALARQYGNDPADVPIYQQWVASHKPFHWFVEFYDIMKKGGFDVIVGNPPYVEYSKIRDNYQIKNYRTVECGNLYAFMLERSLSLLHREARLGLIIPISSFATDRMTELQKTVISNNKSLWLSSFGIRPSKLFEGAEQRLTICLSSVLPGSDSRVFTTKYHRWYKGERIHLLSRMAYQDVTEFVLRLGYPKISTLTEKNILAKMPLGTLGRYYDEKSSKTVYWHRIPGYFIKALDFIPYFMSDRDGVKKSEDYKLFGVRRGTESGMILALLNSSLFYWFWFSISEGYHCGKHEVLNFPVKFDGVSNETAELLIDQARKLMVDLKNNSKTRRREQKTTIAEYQEFYPSNAKPIIDRIDQILSLHYGLTDEELDFIINYDIKYRMGGEVDDDQEE